MSAFSGQRAPDPQEVLPSAFLRLRNPKGQPTLGQRGKDGEILSGQLEAEGRGSERGQGTRGEGRPHQGAHGMKISAFPELSKEAGVECVQPKHCSRPKTRNSTTTSEKTRPKRLSHAMP